MKKVFVLGIMLFLLSGCSKGEEFNCTVSGKDAVFTLKDGIITSYTLEGTKKSQAEIDEINGEYFTSATNNEEGKEALNRYMLSVAGSCN
ncbi:MAG: hypothetical protein HFH47_02955 [Bacilli bacterium]|nr:hypothetical protein [Bacilli bacterium]